VNVQLTALGVNNYGTLGKILPRVVRFTGSAQRRAGLREDVPLASCAVG
jgi:hypothetical protein